MLRRTLDELINKDDPRWPDVLSWIEGGKNKVEVLPANDTDRAEALLATQVTTRSPMGAVVYESGGILVDDGWLRILGSGHERLPRTLPGWNKDMDLEIKEGGPPFLLVADDAIGGFFAVDGGVLGKPGNVFYFAQDSMRWEDTSYAYGNFLFFCFHGDLNQYYLNMRWPGWQDEVAKLNGDQGISVYPPMSCAGPPIGERHRGAVPMAELYGFLVGKPVLSPPETRAAAQEGPGTERKRREQQGWLDGLINRLRKQSGK